MCNNDFDTADCTDQGSIMEARQSSKVHGNYCHCMFLETETKSKNLYTIPYLIVCLVLSKGTQVSLWRDGHYLAIVLLFV